MWITMWKGWITLWTCPKKMGQNKENSKKQEVVINMRSWKQGVQEKAVEKVIHALWKGNEQKNKRRK